jgi:hypothetical protein
MSTRLRKPNSWRMLCGAAVLPVVMLAACGESEKPPTASASGSEPAPPAVATPPLLPPEVQARLPVPTPRRQVRNETAEAIGEQLIWCTPDADLGDVEAFSTAAAVLSHLGVLVDASEETLIWGVLGHDEVVDPDQPAGLLLDPAIWAGCYLSCFVFSGAPTLDQVGDAIILRVPAAFRSRLPAGDFPHPLWHSGDEWSSYVRTRAVELVFIDDRLIAAFRREAADTPSLESPRPWDGNWRWREGGYLKPRMADFAAIFSQDNPHVVSLEQAFAELSPVFSANNCLACHTPDNPAGAASLLVLGLPNQALAARAPLAGVLIGESDGPPAESGCTVAGLARLPNAADVTDAAVRFLEEGDAATEYEWIRLIRKDEHAERISP